MDMLVPVGGKEESSASGPASVLDRFKPKQKNNSKTEV